MTEYEALATEVAKEAREASKALADRIDALKALTPFYVHKMKAAGKGDPDDDFPNFESFQNKIHATEQDDGADESRVRGRRRNGN